MARDRWTVYICIEDDCGELYLYNGLCDNRAVHGSQQPRLRAAVVELRFVQADAPRGTADSVVDEVRRAAP